MLKNVWQKLFENHHYMQINWHAAFNLSISWGAHIYSVTISFLTSILLWNTRLQLIIIKCLSLPGPSPKKQNVFNVLHRNRKHVMHNWMKSFQKSRQFFLEMQTLLASELSLILHVHLVHTFWQVNKYLIPKDILRKYQISKTTTGTITLVYKTSRFHLGSVKYQYAYRCILIFLVKPGSKKLVTNLQLLTFHLLVT